MTPYNNPHFISFLVLTFCSTLLGFQFSLPKFGMVSTKSAPEERAPNSVISYLPSVPDIPIPLPFGLFHGQTSSSNLKLFGMKKCPAVIPNMPSFFEVDFMKCAKEVAKSRSPNKKHPDQDKRTVRLIS